MSILSKYFDKVYCVNLDRRADRWERVSNEFKRFGFDEVERFTAIDGNTLDLTSLKYNQSLLKGELGLIETHLNLIKEANHGDYNNILVMEDDVTFTPEANMFSEYMEAVPKDWDMLYIGGNHSYGLPPQVINSKIIKLNKTYTTHCLAINKKMFETILHVVNGRQKQIDVYYADFQLTHNIYGFYPNMAVQTTDFSDIQNKTVDYTNFFK